MFIQSHGFGSLKPNHAGYCKSSWCKGLNRLFKCLPKSSRCIYVSPGDGRFPAALRESCPSESFVLVAGGLAVVPGGDSVFVLVGPLLAEVHLESLH
jgi:hypothetical protein